MLMLMLGGLTLVGLMSALGMFSRAQVATIKQFGIWVLGIGGLALATLLVLSGRGPTAIAALAALGPLVWSFLGKSERGTRKRPASSEGRGANRERPRGNRPMRAATMSRDEAYQVLGLAVGAGETEIRAAHLRLIQLAHPDRGGSDWLAARINLARDTLLG